MVSQKRLSEMYIEDFLLSVDRLSEVFIALAKVFIALAKKFN